MCMSVWGYVHVSARARRGGQKYQIPWMELEIQVVCEPLSGAAGDQTRELSTTGTCALNYCAISPAPQVTFDILTCISMHMMNTHIHDTYNWGLCVVLFFSIVFLLTTIHTLMLMEAFLVIAERY